MLVLHHAWRSSASRRVRLCLAEKGLAFESRLVDMMNMEHHSAEYLRINPLGGDWEQPAGQQGWVPEAVTMSRSAVHRTMVRCLFMSPPDGWDERPRLGPGGW